jgi:predicted lipoprotein with Yx(FWY)xxD motif
VLESNSSLTYYELSDEVGGTLHCTGACVSSWPPLLVSSATTAAEVSLGTGVKGAIGFVTRSASQKQVTFNSYPIYTFSGDTGPNQSNGQGIEEPGGATWHLVNASATTPASTPVTG